jgi:nicotinamidase-related amidase
MLVDFFDRSPALAHQRGELVAGINDLAARFRSAGRPVIWVRQEFRADLSDAFLDMRHRRISITIEGTQGSRVLPELERQHTDFEIVKKRYSAFFRTDLDALLSSLEAKTLVLAGINSHACVRVTAIDAYQRDYEVILAADCIGSYDPEHHEMSVKYLIEREIGLLGNTAISELLPSPPAGRIVAADGAAQSSSASTASRAPPRS